ncbi:hypothetical protein F4861DRAFT_375373 [Xylaria intraflava]|nr:hypothetical protein F4861DRAFT_375373 [Xylaria intraflava]
MAIGRTAQALLLALGGLGAILLWGVAFFNGTLINMNAVVTKHAFPDGRPLRSNYTGIQLLDKKIVYLVVFYEVLSNGAALGPRLLFVDINFLVVTVSIWMMVESRRRGMQNIALRRPVFFMILWLGVGAAFIQPLYFCLHMRTKAAIRDPTVPYNESIALFMAVLPSFLVPFLLFLPTWLGLDTIQHQGYISLFFASPCLIVAAYFIGVLLLSPWHGLVSKKDMKRPNIDKPWIIATLALVGVLSAIVHVGCIAASLSSASEDLSLGRLYLPSPGKMHSFTTDRKDSNATLMPPHLVAYHVLVEGCHLFTQLDYAVVSAACVIFTYSMLHGHEGDGMGTGMSMSASSFRQLLLMVLGAFIFGPGAAGSWMLAAREDKLRKLAMNARKIQ